MFFSPFCVCTMYHRCNRDQIHLFSLRRFFHHFLLHVILCYGGWIKNGGGYVAVSVEVSLLISYLSLLTKECQAH